MDKNEIEKIKRLRAIGLHQNEIAKELGVSQKTISLKLRELRKQHKSKEGHQK